MKKVGNLFFSKKVDSKQASENYFFYKLQIVKIQKSSFSNILGLRFFFEDKNSKHEYLCKIFVY